MTNLIKNKLFIEYELGCYISELHSINNKFGSLIVSFKLINDIVIKFIYRNDELFFDIDDVRLCLSKNNSKVLKQLINFYVDSYSKPMKQHETRLVNLESKLMICNLVDSNKYNIPELERIKLSNSISIDVSKLDGLGYCKMANEILNKYPNSI